MKTKLEALVAYLAGHEGDDAGRLRAELDDPASEASQFLAEVQELSRNAFDERVLKWLGLPSHFPVNGLTAAHQPTAPSVTWAVIRALPLLLSVAACLFALLLWLDCVRHRHQLEAAIEEAHSGPQVAEAVVAVDAVARPKGLIAADAEGQPAPQSHSTLPPSKPGTAVPMIEANTPERRPQDIGQHVTPVEPAPKTSSESNQGKSKEQKPGEEHPADQGGQVTEANFRRLKVEMTLREVEAVLGQGKELPDEEIPPAIQEHITPETKAKIQTVEPQRWRLWDVANSRIFVGLSATDAGDRVSVLAFVHGGSLKLDCGNPWALRAALAGAGKKPNKSPKKAPNEVENPKAAEPKSTIKKTSPIEDQLKKVLTRENHAKLKKGMTEKEVLAILGPPTSNRVIERQAGFVSRQMIWQLKQAYIIAVFHNGQLDGADSGDGNGGPLPSEKPDLIR